MSRLYFNGPSSPFLDDVSIPVGQRDIEPSYSTNVGREPRLISVTFGDGYSQRAADGINYTPLVYNLTFDNRTPAVITAIKNFLYGESAYYDRAPEEPFFWTPPFPFDDQVRLWTFSKPSFHHVTFGSMTLEVVFTESFEP